MQLTELFEQDSRLEDVAAHLRQYAEDSDDAMRDIDPDGSMDYEFFIDCADMIEIGDAVGVAEALDDADTEPRDFVMDMLLNQAPDFAKQVSAKVSDTLKSIFGMTGRISSPQESIEEREAEGTGSLKPGWMLKKDPKLAKKLKNKLDLAKKRQATYGDKSAGKSVKEEVALGEVGIEFGPETGKQQFPAGYANDARMIMYIVTDLLPRLKDDELARSVTNALDAIDNNKATKADVTLIMDVFKAAKQQNLVQPYMDAIGKFDDTPEVDDEDEFEEGVGTSLRPKPRPTDIGATGGDPMTGEPITRGINPEDNYSPEDLARLLGQQPSSAAPATSPRPKMRPQGLKGESADRLSTVKQNGVTSTTSSTGRIRATIGGDGKMTVDPAPAPAKKKTNEGSAEDYIVAHAHEKMDGLAPESKKAFLASLEKSYPGITKRIVGEQYSVKTEQVQRLMWEAVKSGIITVEQLNDPRVRAVVEKTLSKYSK